MGCLVAVVGAFFDGGIADMVFDAARNFEDVQFGIVGIYADVSEVPGHHVAALQQFSIDDDAAANSRTQGEQDGVFVAFGRAKLGFGHQGAMGIVEDPGLVVEVFRPDEFFQPVKASGHGINGRIFFVTNARGRHPHGGDAPFEFFHQVCRN